MNKNKPDMNYKTTVPYGPATGKEDPGRQPVITDTPDRPGRQCNRYIRRRVRVSETDRLPTGAAGKKGRQA